MASAQMQPLPTSVAVPLYNSGSGSFAASTASVALPSKKQEHLVAGRRKLEEYRKKKAEEKKSGKSAPISEKLALSVSSEERILQTDAGSSSNGQGHNIAGEQATQALPLATVITNAAVNGSSSEEHKESESGFHMEKKNGEHARRVSLKESHNLGDEQPSTKIEKDKYLSNNWAFDSLTSLDASVHAPFLKPPSLFKGGDANPVITHSVDKFLNTDERLRKVTSLDSLDNLERTARPPDGNSSLKENGNSDSQSLHLFLGEDFASVHSIGHTAEQRQSLPSLSTVVSQKEVAFPNSYLGNVSSVEILHRGSTPGQDLKSLDWSRQTQRHSERDEFAGLEQYIDELTQEKFSLQRALDAARSLAESLAQANSSLTEDFNQQGSVINQLQADVEKQQEEIKAQALVLSGFMAEREKAQQESNSAVERSQILAGEVIALEEKVLKLRSNELKLERDLESLKSENDSCRRHLATLEKDRQNLRSMVDALQEEKKLLQGRLRRGVSLEFQTAGLEGAARRDIRDASTSTDDLGSEDFPSFNPQASTSTVSLENSQAATSILPAEHSPYDIAEGGDQSSEAVQSNFEASSSSTSTFLRNGLGLNVPAAFVSLPLDQLRTVDNIHLLITELGNEKDSLTKALKEKSVEAAEMRVLNAELSQKLEVQTQRLELAFSQNMARGGNSVIANSNEEPHEDEEYVDEGDEVVERVLGWIMKLFPTGSSRRRSSKLL